MDRSACGATVSVVFTGTATGEPRNLTVTAPFTYVRFHGRNTAEWWGGGPLRYDYDYKEEELKEWMGRVTQLAEQARRTYLFFNNCHAGQAARNAKLMQELVRQQAQAF